MKKREKKPVVVKSSLPEETGFCHLCRKGKESNKKEREREIGHGWRKGVPRNNCPKKVVGLWLDFTPHKT